MHRTLRASGAIVLAAITITIQSGCLINSSHTRVVRQDEPAQRVDFESDWGHSSFQSEALNDDERKEQGSQFWFGVPFLLNLSYRTVPSSPAYYNDWVARTDTNRDGLISDYEVVRAIPVSTESEGELPNQPPIEEVETPGESPSFLRVSIGDNDR